MADNAAAAAVEVKTGDAGGQAAGAGGAQGGAGAQNTGAGGAQAQGNAAGTAAGAQATGAAAAAQTASWSEKWREEYAGEDKGKLNVLGRYATPKDALDSLFTGRAELQKLMGQVPPGKDATPEQKQAYRSAQGVPDKAEGYFEKLDKGIVFGEADKPVIMGYLTKAHERGDSPAQVAENLKIYHDASVAAVQQMQTQDAQAKTIFENTMREQLKGEYDSNMARFQTLLDSHFPKELKDALMNARLGDDKATPLMLSPGFVKSMITMARELNPMNTSLPGGGMDKVTSVADQLKAYEKQMGGTAWHKDEKSQAHYRELVTYWNKQNPGKLWGRD